MVTEIMYKIYFFRWDHLESKDRQEIEVFPEWAQVNIQWLEQLGNNSKGGWEGKNIRKKEKLENDVQEDKHVFQGWIMNFVKCCW